MTITFTGLIRAHGGGGGGQTTTWDPEGTTWDTTWDPSGTTFETTPENTTTFDPEETTIETTVEPLICVCVQDPSSISITRGNRGPVNINEVDNAIGNPVTPITRRWEITVGRTITREINTGHYIEAGESFKPQWSQHVSCDGFGIAHGVSTPPPIPGYHSEVIVDVVLDFNGAILNSTPPHVNTPDTIHEGHRELINGLPYIWNAGLLRASLAAPIVEWAMHNFGVTHAPHYQYPGAIRDYRYLFEIMTLSAAQTRFGHSLIKYPFA